MRLEFSRLAVGAAILIGGEYGLEGGPLID